MNAASTSSLALISFFNARRRRKIPPQSVSLLVTSSFPRRRRRYRLNRNTSPSPSSDDRDVSISIDFDSITDRATSTLTRLVRSSRSSLRRFLDAGTDAFDDLRTSVRIDPDHHVAFSCQRSSILFLANLFVFGVVLFVVVRAVAVLGLWRKLGLGDGRAVVRRDRSLGGREVVVGTRRRKRENEILRVWTNPVSNFEGVVRTSHGSLSAKGEGKKKEKLPAWWPESVLKWSGTITNEELKGEADRLVRAIMDNRLGGKDYKDDDMIQLRQICKISGARVSFGTDNVRDSFYRAAVDFVISVCCRVMQPSTTVQIDGEDAREFISGLADNIGLQDIRAARIILAAVAARTRSCFLQAWVFEVQGKRVEALGELSKICQIFQIFPPEEYSAEMEMVAAGLKKSLGVEQRKHLLALFSEVCSSECQRIAQEALGLVFANG